eukprot:CAMPEP_0205908936 /NCGR_PEP_ID=MMETSP1325-20131115/3543_1 /ASSEMBLY_ACC=CAM_ASM_000708 /TAXON_ID=236786 /ORGANISM="Florenciella sp., Strain RCC1007" /LENGTH=97 /DNA_ID=CAMNT_0053275189 /DNA_START=154 /DNA_END=445 /DNA_ORIENTATION=+
MTHFQSLDLTQLFVGGLEEFLRGADTLDLQVQAQAVLDPDLFEQQGQHRHAGPGFVQRLARLATDATGVDGGRGGGAAVAGAACGGGGDASEDRDGA